MHTFLKKKERKNNKLSSLPPSMEGRTHLILKNPGSMEARHSGKENKRRKKNDKKRKQTKKKTKKEEEKKNLQLTT